MYKKILCVRAEVKVWPLESSSTVYILLQSVIVEGESPLGEYDRAENFPNLFNGGGANGETATSENVCVREVLNNTRMG